MSGGGPGLCYGARWGAGGAATGRLPPSAGIRSVPHPRTATPHLHPRVPHPPHSSYYLPYAPGQFNPSGELAPVAGTIYDFTRPTPLGLHVDDPQLGGSAPAAGLLQGR